MNDEIFTLSGGGSGIAVPLSEPAPRTRAPSRYAELYRSLLLGEVVPFWLRVGFDAKHGGISNVLDDAGNAVSHDKYLWSQGRALWTFSALCNRVEPRPEWRRFADHLFAYLRTHGRNADGDWVYRLDKDGAVLDGAVNLYVDGFVLHGLGEYFAASGDPEALRMAVETYERVRERLRVPGSYQVYPFEIPPGMQSLDVPMVFSWFFCELGRVAARPDMVEAGLAHANALLSQFHHPEKDALVQYIPVDGGFCGNPVESICMPGSVFESMWFLMTLFTRSGEPDKVALCCRHLRRHLELGWDALYGGLSLAVDLEGNAPARYLRNADCKAWWVQVEALVATAHAYRHTGEPWCLQWHEKIRQWAFAQYPRPGGEWTQWLDRKGAPMESAALPVKDPFHLPRALMHLSGIFALQPGLAIGRQDAHP